MLTTIGALLSAIGIAGMDRLVRFNVLAMSGRAVEAAGDVDTGGPSAFWASRAWMCWR
jgi:high-affinity K+ transport system ATPase subunit B